MAVARKVSMESIIRRLAYVKSEIEISTPQNLTDINIYSENFFRDFLNLIWGFKLQNINIGDRNSAAIDLGDSVSKVAVQVTSTNEFSKIEKTVVKFNEKKLYEKYDKLKVLIIGRRKQYKKRTVGEPHGYEFDIVNDVWDVSKLIEFVGNKGSEEILEIQRFLEAEVQFTSRENLAKEVSTFESLILMLSDENHPASGCGFLEEPDPNGKINDRFSNHSALLLSEFQELYSEYGEVLSDVRQHSGIGQPKLRRLGLYLKTRSDEILNDCCGDPAEALKRMVSDLELLMKKQVNEYDATAIRFFLIDELIRCNVFPNKVPLSA
jgi:hypothetical protein